jgi:hypothetical protein
LEESRGFALRRKSEFLVTAKARCGFGKAGCGNGFLELRVITFAGYDVGVIGCGNALGDRFEMIGCRDVG